MRRALLEEGSGREGGRDKARRNKVVWESRWRGSVGAGLSLVSVLWQGSGWAALVACLLLLGGFGDMTLALLGGWAGAGGCTVSLCLSAEVA